ncbi:MAG TPA: TonB-dependent receptor [Pyrinomonadaceae bacterium]|nr:TonB-dependent receptor [Pyrinomonadaceae bacterium]
MLNRSLTRFLISPLAVVLLLLVSGLAFAQSDTGKISGIAKDQNGAVVPGASVTVTNERTGEERSAKANDDGYFVVPALKASSYRIIGESGGMTGKLENVSLSVGQEVSVNLAMSATGISVNVNVVSGEEAVTNNGSASMGANVIPREVEGLPVNGRQLSQLYLQAPGSVNSGSGTFGDIRFSGRATEQNIVRYDGIEGTAIIDANPGNLNGEIPTPFRLQSSLENVQEFRVDSNNYPAEQGTGTGGQINVVTKSGTKDFHGSAFEYLRNDALDAANFFDNIIGQKSKLRLNQFGGSVGGPVVKDKVFFFFSYEGYRLRGSINAIEAVPGLPSRVCPGGIVLGTPATACSAATVSLIPAFRAPGAVVLRTGPDLFDTVQLQANNIVNENAEALRLDFKLSQKQSAYFRFFRDQGDNSQPDGVTGRRILVKQVPQNGIIALQSVINTNLLNEFKFGYNSAYSRINGFAPPTAGVDLSNLTLNVAGSVAGFALPGQGSNAGIAVPGGLVRANSAQNGRAQPYTPYSLSAIDSLNWTKGNHSFKFGGELRRINLYTDRLGGITYTWSSVQNFLSNTLQSTQFLGDLSSPSPFFIPSLVGPAHARQTYYIAYAQDEWKIKSNLTLSYGLRYEYYTPLREVNNRQIYFDIRTGVLRNPSEDPYHTSGTNFGPRVALTWSPNPNGNGWFGGGKTVLRGGFGIYYGPGQTEDQIQPIESNRISSTLNGGSYPQNPATIAASFISTPTNRQYQPRAYAPDYTIPEKVYQYSFSLQQELPYKLVLTAGYVGSQGRNLFLRSIANRILPGQTTIPFVTGAPLPSGFGVVNETQSGQVTRVTTIREFDILGNASLTSAGISRPYAEIDDKTSGGHDNYRALQTTLGRRFNTGVTMNAQYTFSRSFGNTSGSNEARTAGNNARAVSDFDYDNGYNNFDVRHTFNLSALYDLPFGKGKKHDLGGAGNALLGDWEIGTIVNARSGIPLEIGIVRPDVVMQCVSVGGCGGLPQGFVAQLATAPLPVGFVGVVNTPGGGASRNVRRPDLISGVNPYLTNDRLTLNPAAFTTPAPGTFGNVPRNFLKGPSFNQFDLIFNKRFKFSEATNLEFRTEIFNIFNRPNFDIPGSRLNLALPTVTCAAGVCTAAGANVQPGQPYSQSAAGGTFGLLRQTVARDVGLGTSRQIQFAVRLNF